ncbi:MAG: hypothetical protein GY854_19090 [Deltaproteobacteria bacterium]|nr:hypothetical protein [Deltaproteobacteria bacterium]
MSDEVNNGLPPKTRWAIVWFVLLGAAVLIWQGEFRNWFAKNDEDDSGSLNSPGPLPSSPAPVPLTSLQETDGGIGETVSKKRQAPRTPHQPIEDPKDVAMCSFYSALNSLDNKKDKKLVRVAHYGDSILTTDELSGRIRRILQKRFGDGGHGFVLLGKPWRWYHHLDVNHGARGKWRARPLTSDPISDGLYGLGGVAFETRHRNAVAWAGTVEEGPIGTRVASFDISYLQQPRGGRFDLIVSGKVVETVDTSSKTRQVEHKILNISPGKAKLTVKTHGDGPIRLFGATLESDSPGIVYDSLAINGARASILARFDETHWKSELSRRDIDLIVIMFGANEGHNESLVLDEYRVHLAALLTTIREGAPEAGCLIIGPLDQARRKKDGRLGSRRMPAKLSQAQREVALEHKCAFFDTFTAMGGKKSMARWYRSGLGGGDLVHPTEHGARRIGSWLADAILAGYESFLYGGKQCVSNVTTL